MKGEEIQVTTASPKGQVVIPQEIRDRLGIEPGTKFAVYGRTDVIIFKRLELPTIDDFERLVKFGRRFSKKKGIRKEDVLKDD